MTGKKTHLGLAVLVIALLLASSAMAERGRIYGRITTDRGDILEGPIRWDKNEASWDDILDGNKDRESVEKYSRDNSRRKKYGERERKVEFMGITVYSESAWGGGTSSQSGIAFGHIERLIPMNGDAVELQIKNGETIEFRSGSTDFGNSIREIVIETADQGELELDWYDIEEIEFFDGGDVESNFGRRIYGTVTTTRAGEFTGWICWDMDEMFTTDVIDGSEGRRKRKIEFEDIARIERISSQASLIVTKSGKEFRLDDSNDVDSGNRGIVVSDPAMGRVIVDWDEFEVLEIKDPPSSAYVSYNDFKGGKMLEATVYDEVGDTFSGYIVWDDDERFGWELLDGTYRGVEFDVPFEQIRSIEKLTRRSSLVTLQDGRQFRLRDSNDVNDENKGIYVLDRPDQRDNIIMIEWDAFERIEFK